MSLHRLSILLIALLATLASVFLVFTLSLDHSIQEIQQSWDDYKEWRDEVARSRGVQTPLPAAELQHEEGFSQLINNVQAESRLFLGLVLTLALFTAGLTLWVFLRRIIQPVMSISATMRHIADGDLKWAEAHILRPEHYPREIEDMRQSLAVLKKNEQERRHALQEIEHMAMTDSLTGLANRNQLSKHFIRLTALARREKKGWAFAMVDLDNFKPINDQYGHAAGDLMLRHAADQIRAACRASDVVTRLGGDEFGVFLYDVAGRPAAEVIAARIIRFLHDPVSFDNHLLKVNASVGIAMPPRQDVSLDYIMNDADVALYKAKRAGKNRYVFLEPPVVLGSVVSKDD